MDKRRLRYGKVFKSHIFGGPTIVSTDADVSRAVLQDGNAFVPWYPKSVMELMGKSSILATNGSLQRRVHGLIGSFFKSPQFKSQVTSQMQKYMRESMAMWKDDQIIFIQEETKEVVFKLLVKSIIGMEPGEELQVLRSQFQEYIAGLMSLPVKLPGTTLYRSLQAKKKMVNLVQRIMKEKRKTDNDNTGSPRDAIDALMTDTSGQLTDDMISDNIIDLMIPAENSVPVLVTLAIKYLSECPLVLHYVEEENMRLRETRAAEDRELQWSDYSSLSFTQDVISETLRIGNIITGIMRKAVRDVEIKGHFIPKDWGVFTYFRSVHLDETLYEDPYTFNPWRWKGKETGTPGFSPFGGGQRLCPAMDLARLEATIFLHHMITEFTWEAEKDDIVSFPTVSMKGRMPVRINRRKCHQPEDAAITLN